MTKVARSLQADWSWSCQETVWSSSFPEAWKSEDSWEDVWPRKCPGPEVIQTLRSHMKVERLYDPEVVQKLKRQTICMPLNMSTSCTSLKLMRSWEATGRLGKCMNLKLQRSFKLLRMSGSWQARKKLEAVWPWSDQETVWSNIFV